MRRGGPRGRGGRDFNQREPGEGSAGNSLVGWHAMSIHRRIERRAGHQGGQGADREEGREERAKSIG